MIWFTHLHHQPLITLYDVRAGQTGKEDDPGRRHPTSIFAGLRRV